MRTNYLLITLISCAIFSVFNLGATEMKFRLVTSYQQLQATDTSEILICYESATEKLTFLCDVAKIPDASSSNVRVVTQSYKTTASTSTVMQNLNDSTLLFRKYNETQDYKSYVWKITRGVSSFLKGAYGYIGYYSDNAYLYSYGHHYVNMATRAKRFRFNIDPVSGSTIEWTGEYMNGSYILGPAYVYITATSPYISKTPFNWKIYKRMNPVTFDMGGYSEYATPTAYSSDEATNVKLPYIVLKNATFASYVKFKGWSTVRDDANYIIGKGGDIIPTLPEGTVLYAIFDVTKFTIYFDEGDYGTCKVDSIKSLLPFALPDIDLNMGYYFKGWYSLNQGGIVGQPGDVYPQGATVIMEDDKLTAQYGHAFDVISWSTSGVLLQFLDDALYVNATTETDAQTTVTMLSTAKIDAGLYWVNISNMSAHEGEKITISFMNSSDKSVASADLTIPIIVSSAIDVATNHEKVLCAGAELVVLQGAGITIDESGYSFKKIWIYGGGKIVVPAEITLYTDYLILRSGEYDGEKYLYTYPQMVVNGHVENTSGKIFYDYLLNNQQYYNLAVPFEVYLSDIAYSNGARATYGTSYKIQQYDGENRSEGGTGWKLFTGQKLDPGIGYIIYAVTQPVTPKYGSLTYQKYTYLRFPMVVDLSNGEPEAIKRPMVSAYSAESDNDAGWNLVANPYLADYSPAPDGLTNNGIGLLVANTQGGYDWQGTVRYVVIPTDDGKNYQQVQASLVNLPAFKNFFVQIGIGDALIFYRDKRAQNVPKYLYSESETTETMLGMLMYNERYQDHIGVLISDEYDEKYEINADLKKWENQAGINLYLLSDKNELAYMATNSSLCIDIPIGYVASQIGEYTMSFDHFCDKSNVLAFNLYDKKLNITTNLLESNYLFHTSQGRFDNRFTLSVVLGSKLPSGNIGLHVNDSRLTKYLQNGNLVICNGGNLYNSIGQKIK